MEHGTRVSVFRSKYDVDRTHRRFETREVTGRAGCGIQSPNGVPRRQWNRTL